MSRRDERFAAELRRIAAQPTHSETADELAELAQSMRTRTTTGAEDVARVGRLRRQQVPYEVIRDKGGVPVGTAHRWSQLYEELVAELDRRRKAAG